MNKMKCVRFFMCLCALLFSSTLMSKESQPAESAGCAAFGPQTPRDIDNHKGSNEQRFSVAPDYQEMNLCNIHFHNNAEHKAKAFAILGGEGDAEGYQCQLSKNLSTAELQPVSEGVCGGLQPGDTVEVHWVHSTCQVEPGKGLGSCLSDSCLNPQLRVEAQVFTLVNGEDGMNFSTFDLNPVKDVYFQAKSLPAKSGKPVEFLGSTTGPKYTEEQCSPYQVTWRVRPKCQKLNIHTLGAWCESNAFAEDHAHGVRKLVKDEKLLAPIR